MKKVIRWGLGLIVAGLLVIQVIPYGRQHDNPPVVREPQWDSAGTRSLAETACFDCHSNETDWSPWYTNVAPVSWLVQRDVEEGRQVLNFSEWGTGRMREIEELSEVVLEGEMPPIQYLLLHPESRLTDAEKRQLSSGLSTLGR